MSDKGPSQVTRVAAVGGLIAAFIIVIIVIATSGGGGNSGSADTATIPGAPTPGADTKDPKVQKALANGKWEVEEGDTLTAIADDTGIDEDTLITLNPDIDPQALLPGQHVKLK